MNPANNGPADRKLRPSRVPILLVALGIAAGLTGFLMAGHAGDAPRFALWCFAGAIPCLCASLIAAWVADASPARVELQLLHWAGELAAFAVVAGMGALFYGIDTRLGYLFFLVALGAGMLLARVVRQAEALDAADGEEQLEATGAGQ